MVLPKDAAGAEEHRPITELLAPGALYMKNRGAGVPADKWVRVDTTRSAGRQPGHRRRHRPLAAAELLRGARTATYVGEDRAGRGAGCGTTAGPPTSARAARRGLAAATRAR